MASKASRLQGGVKQASKGLFAGMTRLDERETKTVKEVEKPEEKPVKEQVSTDEKTIDNSEEKIAEIAESNVVSMPETATKEEVADNITNDIVKDQEESDLQDDNYNDDLAINQEEIVEEIQLQNIAQSQPIVQPKPVAQQEIYQQPVVQPRPIAPAQSQVQPQVQIQPQIPVQPQLQYQPQTPIQAQPQQTYQQPIYTTYQQPSGQMPAMAYQEAALTPNTRATTGNQRSAVKVEKQEKTSRYEKDKFLLLDIRGLRDYVEHMAKASNMSATKYIRNLIEKDWEQNNDIYQAHKALEERLKERH